VTTSAENTADFDIAGSCQELLHTEIVADRDILLTKFFLVMFLVSFRMNNFHTV